MTKLSPCVFQCGQFSILETVFSEREAVRPWQYVDAELTGNAGRVAQLPFLQTGIRHLFSLLILILCGPLILLTAFAIRISSPGPILFEQERVGLNGKIFKMYKFRTMAVAASGESDTKWTVPNDPRRTRLGSFLRRTNLDELPNFLMSCSAI